MLHTPLLAQMGSKNCGRVPVAAADVESDGCMKWSGVPAGRLDSMCDCLSSCMPEEVLIGDIIYLRQPFFSRMSCHSLRHGFDAEF